MVLHCRLSSEGRQRRTSTKRASGPPKKIKEKKLSQLAVLKPNVSRRTNQWVYPTAVRDGASKDAKKNTDKCELNQIWL
jgi:hypothetical protein